MATLGSSGQSSASSEDWELWYRDTFDRDCPPSVDRKGRGLATGLAELWARHLFEAVQADGEPGFSSFYLSWRSRRIELPRSRRAAARLRAWLFGTKEHTSQGYVAEADEELLTQLVSAHARLIDDPGIVDAILATADQHTDRREFMRSLRGLATRP